MARILPIALVGFALVLYALWRGAYPDLFEEAEPPPAETATAPAAETPAAPETPARDTAAAPDKLPAKPQLDVVRIDKDGDTVIAGKAEPGASVTVATQDETLAVVKADEHGKWVALPEKPLPEGDHAVTIEATGKDGKTEVGDKTIVVSIPEGKKGEKPLVVAVPTRDFGASEVLQRPEIPPGAEEPAGIGREPPDAAPAPAEKPLVVAEAPAQPAGTGAAGGAAAQGSATDKPVAAAEAPAGQAAQVVPRDGEAGKPPSTVAQASGSEGQTAPATREAGDMPVAAKASEQPKPAAEDSATPPAQQQAAAAAEKAAPAARKAEEAPAAAEAPRIAKPAAGDSATPPAQQQAAAAEKTAPAARGLPEGKSDEAPAADETAAAASGAGKPPAVAGTAPAKPAPEGRQAAGPQPSSGGVSVDSVDYDDRGNLALSGKAEPGSVVEPKIAARDSGAESLGSARADEKGEWRLRVDRPVAPGRYDLTVEERSPEGAPRSRIRLPFERADPIADFPPGDIVVVQPGNSLWRIARRIYGQGVRYTVIYAANQAQIGNPDLIFPGQIFSVPQGDRPGLAPG